MAFQLVCVKCAKKHDGSKYCIYCDACGSLLDAAYDTPATPQARVVAGARGTVRFAPMLPLNDPSHMVSMGEGDTPIVPLPRVSQKLGLSNVSGKLEYFNPTGSFKDRGNVIQVSVLKETGIEEVVDGTGGNAGHSFAAYCARAGITYHGFANDTLRGHRKLHAIAFHGTRMNWISGGRKARGEAARKFAEDKGILLMSYAQNIYFIEGLKTLAYEVAEQLDPLPDHIIVPIGNGSIYQGLYRGFKEMLQDGRVKRMPRLHGAQTQETPPVVSAFEGRPWTPYDTDPTSRANGIGVPTPPRLQDMVQQAKDSGGSFVAVSEESLLGWQKALAEMEGLLVEPTSAIVVGAAEVLKQRGVIKPNDRVLLPLTGFGIKEQIPGF
jgi:threonine synthase